MRDPGNLGTRSMRLPIELAMATANDETSNRLRNRPMMRDPDTRSMKLPIELAMGTANSKMSNSP